MAKLVRWSQWQTVVSDVLELVSQPFVDHWPGNRNDSDCWSLSQCVNWRNKNYSYITGCEGCMEFIEVTRLSLWSPTCTHLIAGNLPIKQFAYVTSDTHKRCSSIHVYVYLYDMWFLWSKKDYYNNIHSISCIVTKYK